MPDCPPPFSAEFELLLASSWKAPPKLEEFQGSRIAARCEEVLNWTAFLELVDRHRLPALVHTSLLRHGEGLVPEDILLRLKLRSDQARVAALQQAAEWARLARRFAADGLEMLPLKGVVLSQHLFGDPTLRHTKDLDLMVRPEALPRAIELLEQDGYRLEFAPTPRQWHFLLANTLHLVLDHPRRRQRIELHWNCSPWRGQLAEELWSHLVPFRWYRTQLSFLDPDRLLLFLCCHGARHAWFQLKWLSDVATLLARSRPEGWSGAVELAERSQTRRALAQTAILVEWLYRLTLPVELTQLVRAEPRAGWLARKALRFMRMATDNDANDAARWNSYHRRLTPSWRGLAALRQLSASPADFQRFRIPDRLFCLYYLLRPAFWVWRHLFAHRIR